MTAPSPTGTGVLVLAGASASLRGRLQPLPWMVLEQLGLDAIDDGGRLVTTTSARRISQQLKADPSAVARSLRALRAAGLVELLRLGPAYGRFGLSSYLLGQTPGLVVVANGAHSPHSVDGDAAAVLQVGSPSGPPDRGGLDCEAVTSATTTVPADRQAETTPMSAARTTPHVRSDRRRKATTEIDVQPHLGLTFGSPS